jgi:hypothetical protein
MSWDEIARKEQKRLERIERQKQADTDRLNAIVDRAKCDAACLASVEEAERQRYLPRDLRVSNRGLLDVLIYLRHRRAKNWVAIVAIDPTAPGGLSRIFFEYARRNGPAKYIVPERLEVGNILEFGADYVTSFGRTKPDRIYAFVTGVTNEAIGVHPYPTYEAATGHRLVRVG